MRRIIVGIDGSDQSISALAWARARADVHGSEVVAVFAWSFFDQGHHGPGENLQPNYTEDDARTTLEHALTTTPGNERVTRLTVQDFPAEAITGIAEPDDLIVVGARGIGGFEGLLLGSVSSRIVETAPCPVAVIHETTSRPATGEIVVGVDGSEASSRALAWAADEATACGAPLRVVHAWRRPIFDDAFSSDYRDMVEEAADELLATAVRGANLDGVAVTRSVVCGGPAEVLLGFDDASLIVVAHRGRSALTRFVLGSTARQVVEHATAPVVVVRDSS